MHRVSANASAHQRAPDLSAHSLPLVSSFSACQASGCRASVLVGLLWCVALLSLVVVGLLQTVRLDLLVAKNYGDRIQAHYLALAGVEKAKALLYHDAASRKRSARNHTGELYDSPENFRDVPFGRGQFRVLRAGRQDEGGKIIFGISDEESRLNINRASGAELNKLYGITPEVVAAIMDYRDADENVSENGAEAAEYSVFQPPYLPRNGPLLTPRELLMVRGLPRDLFFGEDANQNGLLDPDEDDGAESGPPDNRDGVLDAGWSGLITVESSVRNFDAAGEDRVNVKSADETALSAVPGISADLAKAIVAYRGQKQIENLADLLDVTAVRPEPTPPATPPPSGGGNPSPAPSGRQSTSQTTVRSSVSRTQGGASATRPAPGGRPARPAPAAPAASPQGPKLISDELLMEIADHLTVSSEQEHAGPVNVNTASAEVLACLPGIDQELAQAIVMFRQSSGFFAGVADLLKVPRLTRDIFRQVSPRITVRSETFRILSEGKISSTGARQRIEVIVRVGPYTVDTLCYREDL